jgi:hypothetical protein
VPGRPWKVEVKGSGESRGWVTKDGTTNIKIREQQQRGRDLEQRRPTIRKANDADT